MKLRTTLTGLSIVFFCITAAWAGEDAISIGEWRTEAGKALVCGGEEGGTIVDIATRANDFYKSGAKQGSPEYEAYWSRVEKAFKERRCFVTKGMRHIPDTGSSMPVRRAWRRKASASRSSVRQSKRMANAIRRSR